MFTWKTGRITLFDASGKQVAEVAKVKGGWCWYIAGQDISGDTETSSEAMSAVEKALKIDTVKPELGAR